MKIEEERKERRERRQKRVSENDKRYFVIYYDILSLFTICHVYLCIAGVSNLFFDWFQQGGVGIAMAGRQDG